VKLAHEIRDYEAMFRQKYKRRIADMKVMLRASERRAAMSKRHCGFCCELGRREKK
jgi:hypothetical protein